MPWPVLIQIGLPAALLILGFSIGTFTERAHFKRLTKHEAALSHIVLSDLRTFPPPEASAPFGLVTGEVVIASDYFKTFAAALRKIVGGELRAYESLMNRARGDGAHVAVGRRYGSDPRGQHSLLDQQHREPAAARGGDGRDVRVRHGHARG